MIVRLQILLFCVGAICGLFGWFAGRAALSMRLKRKAKESGNPILKGFMEWSFPFFEGGLPKTGISAPTHFAEYSAEQARIYPLYIPNLLEINRTPLVLFPEDMQRLTTACLEKMLSDAADNELYETADFIQKELNARKIPQP